MNANILEETLKEERALRETLQEEIKEAVHLLSRHINIRSVRDASPEFMELMRRTLKLIKKHESHEE